MGFTKTDSSLFFFYFDLCDVTIIWESMQENLSYCMIIITIDCINFGCLGASCLMSQ